MDWTTARQVYEYLFNQQGVECEIVSWFNGMAGGLGIAIPGSDQVLTTPEAAMEFASGRHQVNGNLEVLHVQKSGMVALSERLEGGPNA